MGAISNYKVKDLKNNIVYYLICLYVMLLPFGSNTLKIKSIPLNGDGILLVIVLIYFICLFISKKARERFINEFNKFYYNAITASMFILFIIMLVSSKYSLEVDLAFSESIRFLSYIILFFIIKAELNCTSRINGLIKVIKALIFALCSFGIIQFFTRIGIDKKFIYDNIGFSFNIRIQGAMGNPNTYGGFLVLVLFPILALAIYEKERNKKIIHLVLSGLILVNIVLTGSRGAWLGFAIGIIILAIVYSKKLFSILGVLGVISLLIPKMRGRLMEFADMSQNESRIKLYKVALKMIKQNPIWGVGNGNYVAYYDIYVERYPNLASGNSRYAVHNSYLKVFSELGVIGFLAFISIIFMSLMRIKFLVKKLTDEKEKVFFIGVMVSVLSFLIMNLFDNLFFVPKVTAYFWIIIAIVEARVYLFQYALIRNPKVDTE